MTPQVVRPMIVAMETTVHEIADGVYRLSTYLPDISPAGFTMNQFLVDAEEPLLFHCGPRGLFPLVSEAVSGCCRWSALASDVEPARTMLAVGAGGARRAGLRDLDRRHGRPADRARWRGRVLDTAHAGQIFTAHAAPWEAQFDVPRWCGDLSRGRRRGGEPRARGRGHVPRHVPDAVDRTHHALAGRSRPPHPGAHARPVLPPATAPARCATSPTRTPSG